MKAIFLTVGDELLKGSTLNTNAQFLGREISDLGFDIVRQVSCSDSIPDIRRHLKESLDDGDLVVVSGGLGPTPDDVTREGIADYYGVPLKFCARQFQRIARHYRAVGKKVPGIVKKEAMYPAHSVPLINRYGIALGFYIRDAGKLLVALPGVPRELESMVTSLVKPLIRKRFKGIHPKQKLVLKMTGISEPEVMKRLRKDFFNVPFDFGIYPEPGEVTIRIYSESKKIIRLLKQKSSARLSRWIYSYSEQSLSEIIGMLFMKSRKTLSLAESCTGGLASYEIVRVPGASRYFKGAVNAYANAIKVKFLGVSPDVIARHGAVSVEVARSMAEGVRRTMNSSLGIGITGIAGPSGASRGKPLGLVYIAFAGADFCKAYRYVFWGNRNQVQIKAAKKALELLWRVLAKK